MKKIVIIILISIMSFSIIPKVKAYEVVKNYTDYYFTRYNSDGTSFSDKATLYYINGNPVFCIEPGKKLGSSYSIDENYNLNYKNKIRILLAAYYGYMYGNNRDYRFGLATQSIIWKEILGSYPVYSTELFGQGEVINLGYFISVIEGLIDSHEKTMNLVTDDDIVIGASVRFEDLNKAVRDYTSNDIRINSINGHIMNIIFETVGERTLYFKRKDDYSENYKIFTSGDNQALLMAGNIRELDYRKTVDVKPINVTFTCKDSITKENINNATISINDEIIDCNSTYVINDLRPITYKINSVPEGYILNDKINFYDNYKKENVNVKIYIDPIINEYTVYKTYDEDTPEENAIFELLDSDNKTINVYKTDKEGKFNLELRYGIYTLNQLKGIEGYSLVNTSIDNTKENNKKETLIIRLNDEKILNNDSLVDTINEVSLFNDSNTNPTYLIQTGKENTLLLLIILSLICLLSKKVIAI